MLRSIWSGIYLQQAVAEQNKSGIMNTSCVAEGASTAGSVKAGGSLTAVFLETE